MIKVAMQSVLSCAQDPAAVLTELNRILSGQQLRGQFVSAAYFWLDTQNRLALYSAAGHPPLMRWHEDRLERIQSNGLLLGIMADAGEYPVYAAPMKQGDRFLIYTDGLTEAENTHGDSFGDMKLEQVIRDNYGRSPSALSDELFFEINRWQPASVTQQDDVTLIIIDVV
jgi:sigma-B regulation protein RsbU (phosphoserine phosphatase)